MSLAQDAYIEIQLRGGNVSAEEISAKALAEVIAAVEEMITAVVIDEDPSVEREAFVVGLTGVQEGSVVLRFEAPRALLAQRAFDTITRAVARANFAELPVGAVKALKQVSRFTRRQRLSAEFHNGLAWGDMPAVITPETKIVINPTISGPTVIYGPVLRVGGKDKTTVMIEAAHGTVYARASRELAKTLGGMLYSTVGLVGTATWDAITHKLLRFTVEQIADYQAAPILAVFERLRDIAAEDFDGIEDVTQFVQELRRGEPEAQGSQ